MTILYYYDMKTHLTESTFFKKAYTDSHARIPANQPPSQKILKKLEKLFRDKDAYYFNARSRGFKYMLPAAID